MNPRRLRRRGFTIIELVCVLAIIVVLLSIALGSYSGWTRAAGIDAGASLTAAIFGQARELAITQRVDTQVVCSNFTATGRAPCGMVSVYTNAVLVMPTNALPAGVCFSNAQSIMFLPDGTCSNDPAIFIYGCAQFVLISTDQHPLTPRIVEVNQFSGRIRVHRGNEP